MACEHDHESIVDYLLTDLHINPNMDNDSHRSPLSVAKSRTVMKLLLRNGAAAEDVYSFCRRELGKVFSKEPLKSPVKMFVVGDGGQGKSTLIEAMQNEPSFLAPLVSIFVDQKEVDGVDQKTAGIVPRVFKSRFYGDVLFYDFAGQEAYYSSHAAFVKSAVDTCPPIFVLVIGLHRNDTTITHSISYWLGIIVEQCAKLKGRAPLLVIGSHFDLLNKKSEVDQKKRCIESAVNKFRGSFDLISVIPMDCRYSNSDGMKLLRRYVGTSCDIIRAKLSVSLNSHSLLIYILDRFSTEVAVTLESVQAELLQTGDRNELISFIPTTIPRLVEICVQLNDSGHILFLLNDLSSEKSFIIIDKDAILREINGTMFAPKDFRQHCQLSTSTGVVAQSKLAERFPNFNIKLLISFLSHLELAIPIVDQEVLSLINQRLDEPASSFVEQYLFCPALINLDVPQDVFVHQDELKYRFGWVMSCMCSDDFLNARFLHVLILRLALSLAFDPLVDVSFPALQRQCSVWNTGVCWSTTYGIKILVEIVSKKSVVVLIHSCMISRELLELQSTVTKKVLIAANEFCRLVKTEELLLSPINVAYPFDETLIKKSFSLKCIASSIVSQDPYVVSTNGTETCSVSDLLPVEVYANLGENILQALFNISDPVHTQAVSDRFLSALSTSWRTNTKLVETVYSIINKDIAQHHVESLTSALKSWRDSSSGTYSSLRLILDPLSVFAGRSPLVSITFILCICTKFHTSYQLNHTLLPCMMKTKYCYRLGLIETSLS